MFVDSSIVSLREWLSKTTETLGVCWKVDDSTGWKSVKKITNE